MREQIGRMATPVLEIMLHTTSGTDYTNETNKRRRKSCSARLPNGLFIMKCVDFDRE